MATSAITNTITDPAGTALSGVVVNARLKPNGGGFRVSDSSEATTLVSTTTNGSGVWTLNLERNSNITPGNSYYEVEERIPDSAGGSRTWVIQVGASNQTVYAALVSTPPSSPGVNYLTQSSADARYLSVFAGTLGTDVTQVGTNTLTGTSTTWASSGHKHSLSSDVVGSGLALTNGVLSATGGSSVSVDGPIQSVGTATITGTATTAAPSNHRHPLDPAVAGTGLSLTAGVLSVTTVVPSASNEIQAVGTATVTGTTTSFARANHAHALSPAVVGSGLVLAGGVILGPVAGTNTPQAINTATVTGTSTSWALSDHSHTLNPAMAGSGLALTAGVLSVSPAVPSSGAGSLVTQVNTNTATGIATSYALADHQHSLASGIIGSGLTLAAGVVTPTYGATANIVAVGTATFSGTLTSLARADHAHPLSPAVIGSGLVLTAGIILGPVAGTDTQPTNTVTVTGTATTWATSNHQHALGPSTIGSGLAIQTGQYAVSGLTNSNVATPFLFTISNTNTATATVAAGQFQYHSTSNAVFLFDANRINVTPQSATVTTGETTTNTSYVNLTTSGPAVTVFTGTRVLISLGAGTSNSGTGAGRIAVQVSGATTLTAADANGTVFQTPVNGQSQSMFRQWILTGLTAGLNTFTIMYRTNSGTNTFSNRDIVVTGLPG